MLKNKNSLFIGLLFLAALSFVFISVGGEFLHSYIHHHNDQESHDQCPISRLQAQVFVLVLVILAALRQRISRQGLPAYRVFVIKPRLCTPFSHAPPIIVL